MRPSCSPLDAELSRRTLAIVMAGGAGSRLGDLTRAQAKPALPFGGQYRNIDFPLSNCVNSGIRRIAVATQYKAHSLIQHVQHGWHFLRPELGEFIELWPAQQRCGESWYAGTADAIYQNLDLIASHGPEYVLILAGDHVYKMDYRLMLAEHAERAADVTVGCVDVPVESASAFGIVETDARGYVTRFDEKPRRPTPSLHDSRYALASMGIYVFNRKFLAACLRRDAANASSRRDFGHSILPALIRDARVLAHRFRARDGVSPAYWRDVGTVDSYWQANMELVADAPGLDLADDSWRIWTHQLQRPPAAFTGEGAARRSIVAAGCRIAGRVERSVLGFDCEIGPDALVEESVLLPGARVGAGCSVRRAIVEADCELPPGFGSDEVPVAVRSATQAIVLLTQALVDDAVEQGRQLKLA